MGYKNHCKLNSKNAKGKSEVGPLGYTEDKFEHS